MQLTALGGLFMTAVGVVPLWWSAGHLTSRSTPEVFVPWLGVLTGGMTVVLGLGLVRETFHRRPRRLDRQLSRRPSTRITLVWWPIAGVLTLLSAWEDPTMAGVPLFPILVAFPVGAMFEQPRQEQRYAQLVAAHPRRARAMVALGVAGSVLFGVLCVVEGYWQQLGAFGAFFLMSASYAAGARADLKEFPAQVLRPGAAPGPDPRSDGGRP